MVMKIWSIKNPLLGGVLLASAFSQGAAAAELPASQPAATPGIPTPDQAVRWMATNEVLTSRSTSAFSGIAQPPGIGADYHLTPSRPIASSPLTAKIPSPSGVLSNCPPNVCGFAATQPPVTLGTVSPLGINKTAQNNFADSNTGTPSATLKKEAAVTPSPTIAPNNPLANAAKVSLSTEPGLSKDIAFGQIALQSVPAEKTNIEARPTLNPSNSPLTVAKVMVPEQAIGISHVQNQITSFTGQLVANSWKLITVLPKPQLDSSLLNIGSNSSFQQTDSLSFSPRLTLGTTVEPVFPTKTRSSLNVLFTTQEPVIKPSPVAIPWNQSSFFAKPLSISNSKLDKLNTYPGFSPLSRFEASTKPLNIMSFLATVNTSTLSSNKLGSHNY
jgi:hypothetical protein